MLGPCTKITNRAYAQDAVTCIFMKTTALAFVNFAKQKNAGAVNFQSVTNAMEKGQLRRQMNRHIMEAGRVNMVFLDHVMKIQF